MAELVVPWITVWSKEVVPAEETVLLPGLTGLRYADQTLADIRMGVLWDREHDAQGQGEPLWRKVHARRQREAMTKPRCQVCGKTLPREGTPWLLSRPEFDTMRQVGLNLTTTPPTCEACWPVAAGRCPHLRRTDFVSLRAGSFRRWGIYGDLYRPLAREQGVWASFANSPALPHMIARQLVVKLNQIKKEPYGAKEGPAAACRSGRS